MNEIQNWLRFGRLAEYQKGLSLYEKYGTNKSLLKTFRNRGNLYQTREKLTAELGKLAKQPHIQRVATVQQPQAVALSPTLPTVFLPTYERLNIPTEIEQHFIARAKAANARDKCHRQLVEQADTLSASERAKLVQDAKRHHSQAMKHHAIVQAWKRDGILPEKEAEPKASLSEVEILQLKKDLEKARQKRSKMKKRLQENQEAGNEEKVAYYQIRLKAAEDECEAIKGKLHA